MSATCETFSTRPGRIEAFIEELQRRYRELLDTSGSRLKAIDAKIARYVEGLLTTLDTDIPKARAILRVFTLTPDGGSYMLSRSRYSAAMAPTFEEIKLFVAPFEGNIPNMYVDTEGYVTVGIGNMLPDVRAARLLGFVNRTTKNAASADEKSADFSAVSTQPKAKAARWYKQFTKLDLPDRCGKFALSNPHH